MTSVGFLPEARREGIISKEADGELLIYDLTRDLAHCLNPTAAAVWNLSNGRNSVTQISKQLSSRESGTVDEDVVWLALRELRRAHLLETADWSRVSDGTILGMTRREAIRRIGLGAAIALPVVISITSPTPAMAGSCLPENSPCSTSVECCAPFNCIGNVCV